MSDGDKAKDEPVSEPNETPAEPEKAETPAEPEKAETPAEPAKAETPAEPEKAETPAEPEKAEQPAEPAQAEPPAEPAATPEAEPVPAGPMLGCLIEFETEESLMAAAAKVRDAGYSDWDAHTPYPVHGLDAAMGIKPTILPWIVFGGGLTGCTIGMLLQIYTNGIVLPFSLGDVALLDPFLPSGYPFVVSGKPIFSVPANIPVAFELTILLSAFGAFFGMWLLNRLPRFYHPVFHSARFRRATQDRFFISIEATDALWDDERTVALARSLGGAHVELLARQEG